jgi:2,3-bisphosphoglycerate-independent phosphoglycerate mutase
VGLGRIVESIVKAHGTLLITADHGNCELMRDSDTGNPHTSHTANPVPLLLAGDGNVAVANGGLADVAPTLLALMGLPKPIKMTGISLLRPPGDQASSADSAPITSPSPLRPPSVR